MEIIEKLVGGPLLFLAQVKDWIKKMGCDDHSRCILHNFFSREIRFRHLPIDVLLAFFNRLGRNIATEGYQAEPKKIAVRVCDITPSQILQGPRVPAEEVLLSRIIPSSDIVDYYGGALGAPLDRDRTDQRIALEIDTGKLRTEHLRGDWTGQRPMCWVTKTESIEDLRRFVAPAALATRVRNALGKKGWEDEHIYLIEVTYPNGFLFANEVRVPTVLDGGDCVCFRPHLEPDGWGRTVDLETLEVGLPEGVHPKIPISPSFGLRFLGKLNGYSPGFTFRALLLKTKEIP